MYKASASGPLTPSRFFSREDDIARVAEREIDDAVISPATFFFFPLSHILLERQKENEGIKGEGG